MRPSAPLPLLLLPGLNGDPRVFAPQAAAFPTATVATWLAPGRAEPLAAYARRLAAVVDPGGPCVVVGVSFGAAWSRSNWSVT